MNTGAQDTRLTLGIDIGAHKAALVLFNGTGAVDTRYCPYPKEAVADFGVWQEWMAEQIHDFLRGREAAHIGVCAAGIVKNGVVVRSPNIQLFEGRNITELCKPVCQEVTAENDTNAFLIAEVRLGALRAYQNAVGITLGTGVGGALLIGGKLYSGAHGAAGEVGHMLLEDTKTFEHLASLQMIRRRSDLSPQELAERARSGDTEALSVFNALASALGRGMANVANALDPEAIALGGGLTGAADLFLDTAVAEMRAHLLSTDLQRVEVFVSELGETASALGAAILAYDKTPRV